MRQAMKAAATAFVLMLATTTLARADEASAKEADIRTLLRMSGSGEMGKQVMTQMLGTMKKSMPGVPESFWTDFAKEVRTEELIDLVVPIYERNLSHDDIRELIRFYSTPTGKKFVSVLPRITQESMTVGEAWGRKLAEKVIQKLQSQQPSK